MNNFIANQTSRRISFGKRNNFFEVHVDDMSQRLGSEVAVICYSDDGMKIREHGRPSVQHVVGRYLEVDPPPLLSLYRALEMLNFEDLDQAEIPGLTIRVQTLIDAIDARLLFLAEGV